MGIIECCSLPHRQLRKMKFPTQRRSENKLLKQLRRERKNAVPAAPVKPTPPATQPAEKFVPLSKYMSLEGERDELAALNKSLHKSIESAMEMMVKLTDPPAKTAPIKPFAQQPGINPEAARLCNIFTYAQNVWADEPELRWGDAIERAMAIYPPSV